MRNARNVTSSDVISQLRLPLIVLVTYAHSYGAIAPGYSILSCGWDTYEVVKLLVSQTLVKVAVPVFYIVAGYLFFRRLEQWSWQTYMGKMRRRVVSLLVPYVFWNAVVAWKYGAPDWHILWDYFPQAGIQTDWFGHEQLLTAPVCLPLWFLRDLMVVTLLTPIIYICVRGLGHWLMAVLLVFYLSGTCAFVPGLSAYALCFFTLGAFLAIRREDLLSAAQRWETPACILTAVLALLMMLTYRTAAFSSLMLCFRLTGAVAVICVARRLLTVSARRLPPVVCRASYFVYLTHYALFLAFVDEAFFRMFGTSRAVLCVHYLLCPLVKSALLVAAYCLYQWGRGKLLPTPGKKG